MASSHVWCSPSASTTFSPPSISPGCEYTTTSPPGRSHFGHKECQHNDLRKIVKTQAIFRRVRQFYPSPEAQARQTLASRATRISSTPLKEWLHRWDRCFRAFVTVNHHGPLADQCFAIRTIDQNDGAPCAIRRRSFEIPSSSTSFFRSSSVSRSTIRQSSL
jgi:hypothetical protein